MKNQTSEFEDGYIIRDCPYCGQFCKVPDKYYASYKECYAISYCKRCKKEVKLGVEFL